MQVVRVTESGPSHLVVDIDGGQHRIEHSIAANIHVREARPQDSPPRDRTRLSDLAQGTSGEVTGFEPGMSRAVRRRLLDLAYPSTSVEVALDSTFGDPRAFRVRGTTIALRQQQAEHIWIRPHTPAGRAEG